MCTAFGMTNGDFYLGRTLDWHCSYGEKIIVTPRNCKINYKYAKSQQTGYAIMGTALNGSGFPLYYEAINEKGLCMAGLNFPNNCAYFKPNQDKLNITSYEFIPYVLRKCENYSQAKEMINNLNITDDAFSSEMPPASLHWLICDKSGAITVEQTEKGLKIYDNPLKVLTNNPPFDLQLENLKKYENLSPFEDKNSMIFNSDKYFCSGTGALGLPGDNTSMSRFVRTVFNSQNVQRTDDNNSNPATVFKILSKVECIKGCVRTNNGEDYTVYSVCFNADKGLYFVKTYNDDKITTVKLADYELNANQLFITDIKQ